MENKHQQGVIFHGFPNDMCVFVTRRVIATEVRIPVSPRPPHGSIFASARSRVAYASPLFEQHDEVVDSDASHHLRTPCRPRAVLP